MSTWDYSFIFNALTKEQILSGNSGRKYNVKTKKGINYQVRGELLCINLYEDSKFLQSLYLGLEVDEFNNYLYLDRIIEEIIFWLKNFPDFQTVESLLPWSTYNQNDWLSQPHKAA